VPKLSVVKLFEFEAAHFLPEYEGPCAAMHGHSYKLEVEFAIDVKDVSVALQHGMVMDFGELSKLVQKAVINKLDHSTLNHNKYLSGTFCADFPTAENLVVWIALQLLLLKLEKRTEFFPGNIAGPCLTRVRLWETSSSFVEWRNGV